MLSPILTIARFTVLEALRNRLLWLLLVLAAAGLGGAGFFSTLALTESDQVRSGTVAALWRLGSVFLLAIFIITSQVREFHDKGLELVLALPIARATYLLGKALGFGLVAILLAATFGALSAFVTSAPQALLWATSLVCELLIVTALCLLCVITWVQVVTALSAVCAFYLLARSVAAMQLMARGPLADADSTAQQIMAFVIDALAVVLPRLDEFTRSEWLIYHSGTWGDLVPIATQTVIYLLLLTSAALFDLYRKNL